MARTLNPLMPETPDFEKIATALVSDILVRLGQSQREIGSRLVRSSDDTQADISSVAQQLRLVWNARGAADLGKLEAAFEGVQPSMKVLHQALRSLDR
jgi:hypothetical protein